MFGLKLTELFLEIDKETCQKRQTSLRRIRPDVTSVGPYISLATMSHNTPELGRCVSLVSCCKTKIPLAWYQACLEQISLHLKLGGAQAAT